MRTSTSFTHNFLICIPISLIFDVLSIGSIHNYVDVTRITPESWTQINFISCNESDFDGKMNEQVGSAFDKSSEFEQNDLSLFPKKVLC